MNLAAVALAAALAANPTTVSRISDARIGESSGLAYSVSQPDIVYTMNDSKNKMVVYAVNVSTGKVVGTTDLSSLGLQDPESIYVDPRGKLWLGDLGDNDEDRTNASIVEFDEPGATTAAPKNLQRFPVQYPNGPTNVEGMLVNPTTSQVFLINKVDGAATIYSLPTPLQPNQANLATNLNHRMPANVADGTFTRDGQRALVETADAIVVYDPTTWTSIGAFDKPAGLPKGESMAVQPTGTSLLLGTEGANSPLISVPLPAYAIASATPAPVDPVAPVDPTQPTANAQATPAAPLDTLAGPEVTEKSEPVGLVTRIVLAGLLALAFGVVGFRLVQRRRRLAHRHRRVDERQRF